MSFTNVRFMLGDKSSAWQKLAYLSFNLVFLYIHNPHHAYNKSYSVYPIKKKIQNVDSCNLQPQSKLLWCCILHYMQYSFDKLFMFHIGWLEITWFVNDHHRCSINLIRQFHYLVGNIRIGNEVLSQKVH